MEKIDTLVIPAAGAGTRLRPVTYVTPKEMLRLVDKPIFYYLLAEAYQAGIRRIIFITHKDNRVTKKFFSSSEAKYLLKDFPHLTTSFIETDVRGGDGQAILLAEKSVAGKPFAVTMGDLLTLPGTSILAELIEAYQASGESIISVEKIPKKKTGQYGIVDPRKKRGNIYDVRGIIEKPQPQESQSNLAMTGKYILFPKIFSYLRSLPKSHEELKLAHALNTYAKENTLLACAARTPHYDTGTKSDLLKAEIVFSLA
ncbi:hypothetical protein EXS57_03635, partial [Candidatus Kaiserbacteria bacterium]|nr:hypothetical protein [Candidatus Kaiserbacteria bacterium]